MSGFTVLNDISAREVMVRERMQVMLSRFPDTFVPIGPAVVMKDEIPGPYDLRITSYLNGGLRQNDRTGPMTCRVPQLPVAITRP